MRLGPIVRYCHMDFAQVDACHFLTLGCLCVFLLIGGYRLILCTGPVDNNGLWQVMRPIEYQWLIALAVRQSERAILELHSRLLVLNPEVPLAPAWWVCIEVSPSPSAPTLETGKERLYAGIG